MTTNPPTRGLIALEHDLIIEDQIAFQAQNDPQALLLDDNMLLGDDQQRELQQSLDELESIQGATVALEQICAHLEHQKTGKSITDSEAAVLNIAVEHFAKTLDQSNNSYLWVEGFGRHATKLQQLNLATEGMTDMIEDGLHRLLAYLKKIMIMVFEAFRSLTEGAQRLARRAREIQDRANALENKTAPRAGGVIRRESLVRFFSENARALSPEDILPRYKEYLKTLAAGFSQQYLTQAADQLGSIAVRALDGSAREKIVEEVDEMIRSLKSRSFTHLKEDTRASTPLNDVFTADLPFGGKVLKLQCSIDQSAKQYDGIRLSIADKRPEGNRVSMTERLRPLSYSHIVELSRLIEDEMLFGIYKTHAKTERDLSKVEKIISGATEKMTKLQLSTSQDRSATMYSINFLREIATALTAMVHQIHRYDVITAKRLLEYLSLSIAAYQR